MYHVKEIFYTLQGEGANAGTPAVFCRFAGCNLWSGREEDRGSAQLQFLRHRFRRDRRTGRRQVRDAEELARPPQRWHGRPEGPILVVLTGGEPMLQVDDALIEALHERGFNIAVETNGTLPVPGGIDWVCVSPKAGRALGPDSRRRIEARVSASRASIPARSSISISSTASCNRWTARR